MVLSTYLVAFIVGPLEATDAKDVAGTPLRLLCPPGKLHLTPFGVEVDDLSLRYLADYFDLPYPGESMAIVATPDFAFGAMSTEERRVGNGCVRTCISRGTRYTIEKHNINDNMS